MRYLVDRCIQAEYHKSKRLLDALKPRKDKDGEPLSVDYFVDLPLLALDDLGKERLTEWARESMFDLLDERDSKMRPLIVTTNHTVAELEKHVGDASISRLVGSCKWIELTGADYRVEGQPWWTV